MEKEISHWQFKNPSCVWNLSIDQQIVMMINKINLIFLIKQKEDNIV
jgi:hypothetical protein